MLSLFCTFYNSKATFTKTAIKPKFVDRFSVKNFSVAVDQCTIKFPNFVSIENFLSCLTQVQNRGNIEALSQIWLSWDFIVARLFWTVWRKHVHITALLERSYFYSYNCFAVFYLVLAFLVENIMILMYYRIQKPSKRDQCVCF